MKSFCVVSSASRIKPAISPNLARPVATTSAHVLQAKISSEADKFVMDAPREDPEEIAEEKEGRRSKTRRWRPHEQEGAVEGTGRRLGRAKATLHRRPPLGRGRRNL